jgi:hypothetical protein
MHFRHTLPLARTMLISSTYLVMSSVHKLLVGEWVSCNLDQNSWGWLTHATIALRQARAVLCRYRRIRLRALVQSKTTAAQHFWVGGRIVLASSLRRANPHCLDSTGLCAAFLAAILLLNQLYAVPTSITACFCPRASHTIQIQSVGWGVLAPQTRSHEMGNLVWFD